MDKPAFDKIAAQVKASIAHVGAMQDLGGIVARALADFAAARSGLAGERQGALSRQGWRAFGLSSAGLARGTPRGGRRLQQRQAEDRGGARGRGAALAEAKLGALASPSGARRHAAGAAALAAMVIRTWQRIEEIWRSIGFEVADGPEIENDWFNFTRSSPENHPSRSMQDTFYVDLKDKEACRAAHAHQPDAGALRACTSRRSR